MAQNLRRRLGKLEETTRPACWPDGRPPTWTDEQLYAVIREVNPGLLERVQNMTDDELLAILGKHGM